MQGPQQIPFWHSAALLEDSESDGFSSAPSESEDEFPLPPRPAAAVILLVHVNSGDGPLSPSFLFVLDSPRICRWVTSPAQSSFVLAAAPWWWCDTCRGEGPCRAQGLRQRIAMSRYLIRGKKAMWSRIGQEVVMYPKQSMLSGSGRCCRNSQPFRFLHLCYLQTKWNTYTALQAECL